MKRILSEHGNRNTKESIKALKIQRKQKKKKKKSPKNEITTMDYVHLQSLVGKKGQ